MGSAVPRRWHSSETEFVLIVLLFSQDFLKVFYMGDVMMAHGTVRELHLASSFEELQKKSKPNMKYDGYSVEK